MDGTHQQKEVYGETKEKKKKKKVEEIQLANLASPGSLASNQPICLVSTTRSSVEHLVATPTSLH